jgi:hypothetical protein
MTRLGLIVMAGVIAGCALVGLAHAQHPTQIQPNGQGGYNIYTPAQFPQQVIPNGAGGYYVSPPMLPPPVYQAPAYAPPPAYIPPPYLPQGAGPFNGQSAGSQMYGR